MAVTHAQSKNNQCQRSVGSKDSVETDERTDTTDRITFPANVVASNHLYSSVLL